MNPMTGIVACRVEAGSGKAAALTPAMTLMTSRLLMLAHLRERELGQKSSI
jgi:hypothetical protein